MPTLSATRLAGLLAESVSDTRPHNLMALAYEMSLQPPREASTWRRCTGHAEAVEAHRYVSQQSGIGEVARAWMTC
jgi:hypothetical protein